MQFGLLTKALPALVAVLPTAKEIETWSQRRVGRTIRLAGARPGKCGACPSTAITVPPWPLPAPNWFCPRRGALSWSADVQMTKDATASRRAAFVRADRLRRRDRAPRRRLRAGDPEAIRKVPSIANVLDINIAILDHITLSRRGGGLTILPKRIEHTEPLHLLVEATVKANGSIGNTVSGRGGGGTSCTSAWMRDTHKIVAVELTLDNVGDVTDLPDLLDQIDADIGSMTAEGAYDGETVYAAVPSSRNRGHYAAAGGSGADETTSTQRNQHIATTSQHGAMIGRSLLAWTLPNQRAEANVSCNVLNGMTGLGMPTCARVRVISGAEEENATGSIFVHLYPN